jgi:translation elongation factor EF-1alpha
VSPRTGQAKVAAIEITAGELHVGDTVHLVGHTANFTQKIDSMQVNRIPVQIANVGDQIGVQVAEHAYEHDQVFRVVPD